MYAKLKPVKRRSHLDKVRTRYATQIEELQSLHFQDVCIYYDYAPPYHFFDSFFFSLFLKFLVSDTWALAWPLTYATICSLRCHPESGTYVNTYGLGSIFYTELPNGTLCISASWGGDDRNNETARVFKRYGSKPDACGINVLSDLKEEAARPTSLAKHWNRHLNWVRTFQEEAPKGQASLEDFTRLSIKEMESLYPDRSG